MFILMKNVLHTVVEYGGLQMTQRRRSWPFL